MFDPEAPLGAVVAGRYRLEGVLGSSTSKGTSAVYAARDARRQAAVALRLVEAASLVDLSAGLVTETEAVEAYRAQLAQVAKVRHPSVITVTDWGDETIQGRRFAFSVTNRWEHGTLREYLDRGRRLTPSQAVVVGLDACRALHAVHSAGHVHGDVRPATLVIGDDGRVRLIGLGAKRAASAAQMSLEQSRYAAPEIGLGAEVSPASDVYALAITLVEAMSGEVPNVGDTVAATLANRVERLLPVSADFGAVAAPVERAGRPMPEERGSALALGQALAAAAGKLPPPEPLEAVGARKFADVITRPQPVVAPSARREAPLPEGPAPTGQVPVVEPEAPASRRRWRRVWLASAVAVIAVGGVVAASVLARPAHEVPDLAAAAEAEARNLVAPFGWDVVVRAERSVDVEFGAVIRTVPPAGVSLRAGSRLEIVVSQGPPLGVLLDVRGQARDEAVQRLRLQGLSVAVVEESSEGVPVGVVSAWRVPQQPSLVEGDEVLEGTVVEVVVSTGPAPRQVPLLVGMTVDEARRALERLGLVARQSAVVYSATILEGIVAEQSPPPNSALKPGGEVLYAVSRGPDLVALPAVFGERFDAAERLLVEAGFVVGEVKGRKTSGLRQARLGGEDLKAGAEVPRGSTIDLVFP
jgi:serine/threonine-protein kinase